MMNLPKYDAPPVVETVLSVQFEKIPGFTNAHVGWYWKEFLSQEWASIREVPRLNEQFERFDEELKWLPSGGRLSIKAHPESERNQLVRDDNERMLQIQDSRLVYNWRKNSDSYPSYKKVLAEFQAEFTSFKKFCKKAGFGDLVLNQWEITYVNHIPKGELWDTPKNWKNVIPKLTIPSSDVPGQEFDSFNGEWHHVLGENKGRVHISLNHARTSDEMNSEVLLVQLTARGPVETVEEKELISGFDLGHESIVLSFTSMTSEVAHKVWQRRE